MTDFASGVSMSAEDTDLGMLRLEKRVARAITNDMCSPGEPGEAWTELGDEGRAAILSAARAALSAIPLDQITKTLRQCADDLEAEVKHRYQGMTFPAAQPKYDRDMAPVISARALLADLEGRKG